MKIIDSADNQNITLDNHGLLCREYLPITDNYDEKQLRVINRGLYLTDDAWKTSRAGIGDFAFYNPKTGKMEESYGVIADTLVGHLILGENVGIYNTHNSIVMDETGFTLTADKTSDTASQVVFNIQKKFKNSSGEDQLSQIMYLDTNGDLVLNGSIRINSVNDSEFKTLNDLTNTDKFTSIIQSAVHNESQIFKNEVEERYQSVLNAANETLKNYKAELGQYIKFDGNGLTLGADYVDGDGNHIQSNFKTVIDNRGMYFKEGEQTVSYIANSQLYIFDAVIKNSLVLGGFFFSPRADGGVSVSWQGG